MSDWRILEGDCRDVLATLPAESVQCCITSPPYWGLRDYGTATWQGGETDCDHRSPTMQDERNESRPMLAGSVATNSAQLLLAARSTCGKCGARRIDQQIGLERNISDYLSLIVDVFRAVRRVLRPDGTLWLNMGDAYSSSGKGGGGSFDSERPGWALVRGKRTERGQGRWGGGNIDCAGLPAKNLIGMPWRVAFALQDDGWILRSDIIWHKPNPMPESVSDRPTKSHEYIFLFSKSARYFYDADAIREPLQPKTFTTFGIPHKPQGNDAGGNVKSDNWGRTVAERRPKMEMPDGWDTGAGGHGSFHREGREAGATREYDPATLAGANKRDVWTVATHPYPDAHFATFPPDLIVPCVLAGCPVEGTILDPFAGAGTTGLVATRHDRHFIGIELNPQYAAMARKRIAGDAPLLQGTEAAS